MGGVVSVATGKLLCFPGVREPKPKKVKPTSQTHLLDETVSQTFRCPVGCGRDFHSEQAVAGHLGHCYKRKKIESRQGVAQCRAIIDRLGKKE